MTTNDPTHADRGQRTYHHGDLRHALLRAAEQELAERGVEGFTLRGCARRAGVSHAAPAHHFGDAAGLLTALTAEGFTRFVAAMRTRAQAASADPFQHLVALGLGYVDFALGNPALFQLMHSSFKPDFAQDALVCAANDAFGMLVAGVGAVRGDDPLATPDGRRDVMATWSLVHGLANLLLSGRSPMADPDHPMGDPEIRAILERMLPRGR